MTPGSVRASEIGFILTRGSSCTSCDEKWPPRCESDWINDPPPCMLVLSSAEPSSKVKLIVLIFSADSSISGVTEVRKPNFQTTMRYVPGERLGMEYSPATLVSAEALTFVATL